MNVSKPLSSSDFETKHVLSMIVYCKVRESCSLTLRAPSNGRRTIPLYLTTCIQVFRFAKKACCPFRSSLSGKVKFFRHALTRICTDLLKYVSRGCNVQQHHVAAKSLSVITLYHLELGKNVDFAVEIFQYQEIFYY